MSAHQWAFMLPQWHNVIPLLRLITVAELERQLKGKQNIGECASRTPVQQWHSMVKTIGGVLGVFWRIKLRIQCVATTEAAVSEAETQEIQRSTFS